MGGGILPYPTLNHLQDRPIVIASCWGEFRRCWRAVEVNSYRELIFLPYYRNYCILEFFNFYDFYLGCEYGGYPSPHTKFSILADNRSIWKKVF